MLLVGLTGGIGAGKSTVAGLLADRGAVIVDADTIAREVVKPGTPALAQLVDRFGDDILLSNGTLNRPALAARVFGDPEALQDLNAITHPAIRDRMASEAAVHAGTDSVVILDIPLLKEETRDQFGIVGVIVVDVGLEVAVERLLGTGPVRAGRPGSDRLADEPRGAAGHGRHRRRQQRQPFRPGGIGGAGVGVDRGAAVACSVRGRPRLRARRWLRRRLTGGPPVGGPGPRVRSPCRD